MLLSKKTLGWRTMLVIPELETEIRILLQNTGITQVPTDSSASASHMLFANWTLHNTSHSNQLSATFTNEFDNVSLDRFCINSLQFLQSSSKYHG